MRQARRGLKHTMKNALKRTSTKGTWEAHMQKSERQLVNHNALAIGAIVCIIALMLMFNAAFTPHPPSPAASSSSASSPKSLSSASAASPSSQGDLASANPSSLSVPVDTGIYVCRSGDMKDCTDFCSQVHLQPKRCMIKLSEKVLDSSMCVCSTPE